MRFFLLPYISKNHQFVPLLNLLRIFFLTALLSPVMAEQCSNNPVSECVVDAKIAAVNSRIQDVSSKLQTVSSMLSTLSAQTSISGSLIAIFAQIDSNLKPLEITGPTDYIGSATVAITITNNSAFPINISCEGPLSMRGYSGNTITDASNIKITNGQMNHKISLNATSIPQGQFKTVTQIIHNITSVGSSQSGTLWGASLGTEAGFPLDCTITFLNGLNNNSITHIFVPIPYE